MAKSVHEPLLEQWTHTDNILTLCCVEHLNNKIYINTSYKIAVYYVQCIFINAQACMHA